MRIEITEKAYLMAAIQRWNEEEAGYYELPERERRIAWDDLLELVKRCRQLLPTAKPSSKPVQYLEQLWLAEQAIKEGRLDSACGYLSHMIYCNLPEGKADSGILANIIGLVEEKPYVLQKVQAHQSRRSRQRNV